MSALLSYEKNFSSPQRDFTIQGGMGDEKFFAVPWESHHRSGILQFKGNE